MFNFTERLASIMYGWTMDATESSFDQVFDSANAGYGMEYCLFFLLGVSLLSTLTFYFGISSNIRNSTPKNYLLTMIIGYLVLVGANYLGIASIYGNEAIESFNLVKICLMDIFYFVVLYEIFSLVFKGFSNASWIDLISILFNKKI